MKKFGYLEDGYSIEDILCNEEKEWGELSAEDKLRVLAVLYLKNDWSALEQTMSADWEEEIINAIKELLDMDVSELLESEGVLEEYKASRSQPRLVCLDY